MVANRAGWRRPRRIWTFVSMGVVVTVLAIPLASWWLTAPLDDGGPSPDLVAFHPGATAPDTASRPLGSEALPEWPEDRLEGPAAKRYLLAFMERAVARLEEISGYTATLTRQERINGELRPEQRLRIKVRHEPFSVYLRFESPRPGREALYHEGRFDNHVLVHNGDWTRRFLPRVKLDPNGPIALADNRHPITEIGLAHLSRKLLHFRKLDLDDPHAETILDRVTDEDGSLWYRSLHSHSDSSDDRPFCRVEVRYSPECLVPLHIVSYDWPEPALDPDSGELKLAERYHYEDVEFDVAFSELDFDPRNPEYDFERY
ncbi:DUF1571 domain-containing protein [Tautonia sociabilis]|uniref:DUF1571 domain-containing protein n=1 Tax=Tautonia sociabilis TaxID=2080755 RepID=A0A432MP56_9BACT|nr:DUF1571 domain-containing protein [Tautonia sociabilis]RUL88957.1 DUF1571 domain-containing protein [Tautonia sociabilis]